MTEWGSVRQALAFLYSCRKGPQLSRPSYTDAPRSTGRSWGDVLAIAALLHCEDGCAVKAGSHLDDELERWAMDGGEDNRTAGVRAVEDRMRRLLDEHGLRRRRQRMPVVRRFDFTDAEGRQRNHLVEALAERARVAG